MKAIILLYFIILTLNCAVVLAFWIFIMQVDIDDYDNQFSKIQMMGGYNRLSLALMLTFLYKLLFTLRRVEIQMDPIYESHQQVLKQIAKLIKLERAYLTAFVLTIITLVIFTISITVFKNEDNVILIMYYSTITLFLTLNCVLIFKFIRVSWYFIRTLRMSHNFNTFISKFIVLLVAALIAVALCRNFLIEEIIKILSLTKYKDDNVQPGEGLYSHKIQQVLINLRTVTEICFIILPIFINSVLRFFASQKE